MTAIWLPIVKRTERERHLIGNDWDMISAGVLRHRVTIEQPPVGRDKFGQRQGLWEVVGSASAFVQPLSGTEAELAHQLLATATARVLLRFRRDITLTTKMRLKFRGRYLNIGYLKNLDELNCIFECLVTETKP